MQRTATKRPSSSSLIKKEDDSVKRTKKQQLANSQSNTLFNYFSSNKKIEPDEAVKIEVKTEVIAITDFKPKEEAKPVSVEAELSKAEQNKKFMSLFSSQQQVKKEATERVVLDQTDETDQTSSSNKENRKCPFYKRIEGTKIVVDAFSYGEIENANAYFLSHYHYDHFIGLTKHFKQTMYCSQITANLVLKQIRVDKSHIRVLEYNKFINVYDNDNDVQVCLLDANHCPGSAMFLFKLNKLRKFILHTGDFRASNELVSDLFSRNIKLDIIYLDTTYLDSYYKFLPQSKIIQLGIDLVRKEIDSKPNALIVCGSYTIGKERIFIGIAESLDLKVYVTKDKKTVIDCLEDKILSKRITLNPNETNLHVIPMGKLNIKDLESYAAKFENKYEHVIALKPSGWTHDSGATTDGLCVVKKSKNIIIYGLEYSEHSSFAELENCIRTLKPKRVIPTVNVGRKDTRDKMQSFLNEWLSC